MAIDVNKLSEGIHYELIPLEEDPDAWAIRVLEGSFAETIIKYGQVTFDGRGSDTTMKFNFDILSSPDDTLVAEESIELQEYAGDILTDLIARGLESGATVFRDKT